jgi:transposase
MFAPRMKAILLRAFAIHKRRDTLATSTLYQYRCNLQWSVDRCLAHQPTNPHGQRLQKRDVKMRDPVFLISR